MFGFPIGKPIAVRFRPSLLPNHQRESHDHPHHHIFHPHRHDRRDHQIHVSMRTDWTPPSHCVGSHSWEHCTGGRVPPDAVHGGIDLSGGPIYVGRAFHDGDLLPAKVCPHHNCAYVCFSGQEVRKYDYEVLKSRHVAWKEDQGGQVPPEAIRIGHTSQGEPLYVGRVLHNGTLTVGKIHPSHGVLYVPYDGREMSFPRYEVLVLC